MVATWSMARPVSGSWSRIPPEGNHGDPTGRRRAAPVWSSVGPRAEGSGIGVELVEAAPHQQGFLLKLAGIRPVAVEEGHGVPGAPDVAGSEVVVADGDVLALVAGGAGGF